MRKLISGTLSTLKYLLALMMMYAGITTAFFITPVPYPGVLGFLYSSKTFLIIAGSFFFISGATLFVAKILKSRKWIGRGLFLIYLCFLFGAGLNIATMGTYDWEAWGPNFLASLITAILYLRWKYQILYAPTKIHYVDADGHIIKTEIKDESDS